MVRSRAHITEARPDSSDALALIAELDAHLGSRGYPQQSRHGYSVQKLLREAVAFFVVHYTRIARLSSRGEAHR